MATIDEKVLWGAAEKLRDKCDPADYKNVVLGLVFLKYVSDRYMAKYNARLKKGKGQKTMKTNISLITCLLFQKKLYGITLLGILKALNWGKK